MFRYFYRIWDKFKYKNKDNSDIVGAAIYTYKGLAGKDERYIYKHPDLEENILTYNFRTIDVERIDLANISDENPLKLVFKMAKKLLETEVSDEKIFLAKVKLFKELVNYNKFKTTDQRKALTYFLKYLFLIEDRSLSERFKEIRENAGGALKMSVDEIREKYLEARGEAKGEIRGEIKGEIKGKIAGKMEGKIEVAKNLLDILDDETIALKTGLDIEIIRKLRAENNK